MQLEGTNTYTHFGGEQQPNGHKNKKKMGEIVKWKRRWKNGAAGKRTFSPFGNGCLGWWEMGGLVGWRIGLDPEMGRQNGRKQI
jgi:hypothetical protein